MSARRCRARRVFDAEGFERGLREAQAVLDRLVGHVALEEMLDQLRQHALDPAGVARLEQLGGAAMQRAALARRQPRVQHVVDDAAREAQEAAARLTLFLEQALLHEPVDRIVDVARLRQRRQIARRRSSCR